MLSALEAAELTGLSLGLGFGDRILRPGRDTLISFEGLVGQLNGLFKLRVMAADNEVGALGHLIIWINAAIFNDPLPVIIGAPEGELRCGHTASIAKRDGPGDTHQAAPCSCANHRTDFFATEEPWEGIPT
jgi:hypothetical protein